MPWDIGQTFAAAKAQSRLILLDFSAAPHEEPVLAWMPSRMKIRKLPSHPRKPASGNGSHQGHPFCRWPVHFRGWDEIRNWVKSGLDQGSRLEAIEPSVEKGSGTLAYETRRTRRRVGSVVHLGQYLIVMGKIGGQWKIAQHFSLNAEETAAVNKRLIGLGSSLLPEEHCQ